MSITLRYSHKVYVLPVSLYNNVGGDSMKQEYKPMYEKFGLNVVYYRKRKRMTQMKLAELVDIDRSHISAIELGNVGVSFDVIFKLCEVLEITPKELFDFRDYGRKPPFFLFYWYAILRENPPQEGILWQRKKHGI